jgi:hypothetical protein
MPIPHLDPEAGPAQGKDLDSNRGSLQGIVKCPRPQLPPVEESLWGMDLLGGWTTARRCPRTPGRGSAPVKRHSRIAVAGEQPHPRSRMGRSRRQTRGSTPTVGIGGLRRAAAQHPSSPPNEEVGSDSPDRGSRHLAPSHPSRHRAEHSPVPNPLPQMGSPSRPQIIRRPGVFLRDRDSPPGV